MAMNAEHRSKFAALHRQWWRLHMSEKFSSGTKTPKQTNKIYNILQYSYPKQLGHKNVISQNEYPELIHTEW